MNNYNNTYLAFYLGRNPEATIWDKLITIIDGSPFSHVELAIKNSLSSYYDCYSSSPRDGGVRHKQMALNPSQWVLVPININLTFAMEIFNIYKGLPYDLWGLATTKVKWLPNRTDKMFCSELVACMYGLPDYSNYGVKKLYNYVKEFKQ